MKLFLINQWVSAKPFNEKNQFVFAFEVKLYSNLLTFKLKLFFAMLTIKNTYIA